MALLPRLGRILLPLFLLLLLNGCSTDAVTGENPRIPATTSSAQLRPGDSLTVALLGIPDPTTHSAQIDEQGLISLPYIGPVNAAGATTSDLAQRVRETYITRKFYTTVDVSVTVTERYVYIGGEVAKPNVYMLQEPGGSNRPITVLQLFLRAGGATQYADIKDVTLRRVDGSVQRVNLKAIMAGAAPDLSLVADDMVIVND